MTRKRAWLLLALLGLPSVAYPLWCFRGFYLPYKFIRTGDALSADAEAFVGKWTSGQDGWWAPDTTVDNLVDALGHPTKYPQTKIEVKVTKISDTEFQVLAHGFFDSGFNGHAALGRWKTCPILKATPAAEGRLFSSSLSLVMRGGLS